ncbi:CAP domain-containing protein [Nonomuraea sp. 3N208]|uniref:CAP domain-containing protein n=1 Tax=Nonomuraea sp. 3N208 TaxID=3457421 RepID=UPI003FD1BA64
MSHFSPFSHQERRLVCGSALSRPRRAAALATGTVLVGLSAALSPAQPAVAAAAPLKGAGTCANIDLVYRAKTAFPNTSRGRFDYIMQSPTIERAVLCLVNAERTALKLLPLQRFVRLGKKAPPGLDTAAARHAADAVRLRWWGKVQPGKNCIARKDDPTKCDSHINPQTRSTPLSRAQAVGYGRRCTSFSVAENTYVGWGPGFVTPRAAVSAWMDSKIHRDHILNPAFRVLYTEVAWGSADPAAGSITPALTYVQMFGSCA